MRAGKAVREVVALVVEGADSVAKLDKEDRWTNR